MADEFNDSKCSLKSSKKTNFSGVEYIGTLKIPNFFILPEYDDTYFDVKSPSFEYANATWKFKFIRDVDVEVESKNMFDVYLLKINSKTKQEAIICTINFLDNCGEKYHRCVNAFMVDDDDDDDVSDDDDDDDDDDERYPFYIGSFNKMTMKLLYGGCDNLTLIVHLISNKSFKVVTDQVPRTMDADIDVLSQDFKKLFLDGKNHDLTLRVADKEFRVHQDILIARSQVFQAMLTHDMTEKNKGIIDVPDCDPQAMEQFLFYVYSGKVETLNQENVLGLYYAADKYNMMLLKEQCTEYIKKSLTPSIICGVIQLALNHSDSDLLECATDYFLDHTREIFPTLEWMSFMKTNSIAANELLIKASEKWNRAN